MKLHTTFTRSTPLPSCLGTYLVPLKVSPRSSTLVLPISIPRDDKYLFHK